MAAIDCLSPVGLRDDEDNGGFGLTLQLTLQVKLTIDQDEGLLLTDKSQSLQGWRLGSQDDALGISPFLAAST